MLDLTNVQPSKQPSTVLPAGTYNAFIDEAEVKQTKSGTGSYIKVKYKVVDEQYKNRVVFNMYNIKNDNPKAVEIGKQQLRGLIDAIGDESLLTLKDASQLVNKNVAITVKIDTNDKYGDQNRVVSHSKATNLNQTSMDLGDSASIPF